MILPRYGILITPEAENDIDNIYDFIAFDLGYTNTAEKYVDGITDTIYGLALTGNMVAFNGRKSLQQKYGRNVRTARYKKVSIIYTVRENLVVVHSVIASSNIK